MLNFIFGLNTLDSCLAIANALAVLLCLCVAIKGKNKLFYVGLIVFAAATVLNVLYIVFKSKLTVNQTFIDAILAVVAAADIAAAILFVCSKPKLRKSVWIVFVILNLVLALAASMSRFAVLFDKTNGSTSAIYAISEYAQYAKPAVVAVMLVILLVLRANALPKQPKPQEVKQNEQPDDEKSDETAQKDIKPDCAAETAQKPDAETQPAPTPQLKHMYCKSCGYKAQTDATVCPKCYNRLTPLNECPVCHNLSAGRYCGKCGTKLF